MNVVWAPQALQDREAIWNYIAEDNPRAAKRIDELFSTSASRLDEHPYLGRPGKIAGTRELIVHPSYRLVYEAGDEAVRILALVHTARQWPPAGRER